MDQAFDKLHAAHFGNAALPWEEFEAAAAQYFTNHPAAPDAHDAYFNNFTVIWRSVLGFLIFDPAFIASQGSISAPIPKPLKQGQDP